MGKGRSHRVVLLARVLGLPFLVLPVALDDLDHLDVDLGERRPDDFGCSGVVQVRLCLLGRAPLLGRCGLLVNALAPEGPRQLSLVGGVADQRSVLQGEAPSPLSRLPAAAQLLLVVYLGRDPVRSAVCGIPAEGLAKAVREPDFPDGCFSGALLDGLNGTRGYDCVVLAEPHQGLAGDVLQPDELVLVLSQLLPDSPWLEPFLVPF